MRSRLLIVPLYACATISIAQTAIRVTPCELIASPEKYAGKVVEVRARINLAFENFSIAQEGCEDAHPGVWLIYGGDEPTPTSSTVNDLSRESGSVMRIDGVPVPLAHDANLDLFKRRLTAIRPGMIGDSPCYGCYLYNVTATLTGVFFAATIDAHQYSGYGHLGCCHLLAIERVADVAAQRTAIPVGTEIQCSRDAKKLPRKDAEHLNSIYISGKGLSDAECSDSAFCQMEAVAALWGDMLDIHQGYSDGGLIYEHTETSGWRTLDRLRHYELSIELENPGERGSTAFGGTATRVSCDEITPPLAPSVNLSCRDISNKKLRSTPLDSGAKLNYSKFQWDLSNRPEMLQSLKDQAASTIDIAAKELGLTIDPGTKSVSCDPPTAYRGKAYGSCSWSNNTGTMRIDVSLMRSWRPKKNAGHDESSWVLTSAGADVCEVEK